jgi:23S rRNA (guanosine2251-2'-O)-methyltransferase
MALWIYGHHAVIAALNNPRRHCHRLYCGEDIASSLGTLTVPVSIVDKTFFQKKFGFGAVHQGIALETEPLAPVPLQDFLTAHAEDEALGMAVFDHITDPQNAGAMVRSAAALGLKGIVLTHQHSVDPQNPALIKAASGAIEHIPLMVVTNLVQSLEMMKKNHIWVVGLDERGEKTLLDSDLKGRIALVLGAEGDGLRRLTKSTCDWLIRLPTQKSFSTLNVSNAAALAFYEFHRQNGV